MARGENGQSQNGEAESVECSAVEVGLVGSQGSVEAAKWVCTQENPVLNRTLCRDGPLISRLIDQWLTRIFAVGLTKKGLVGHIAGQCDNVLGLGFPGPFRNTLRVLPHKLADAQYEILDADPHIGGDFRVFF